MGELSQLPNIGKALEEQLAGAGIRTPEELRALGSREAWLRIRGFDESACLHRLYALEGAIRGVPKARLDGEAKARLQAFFNEQKRSGTGAR